MTNFFAKSKAEPSTPSTRHKEDTEATDFDKVFKPFALRKGVEVAPINYFSTRRGSLDGVEENPTVVLDDETLLSPSSAPVVRSPSISSPGTNHILLSWRILTKPLP